MIINSNEYPLPGMNLEDGIKLGYRDENGETSIYYRKEITKIILESVNEFELALRKFCYNFPIQGNYRISWKIERIEDE